MTGKSLRACKKILNVLAGNESKPMSTSELMRKFMIYMFFYVNPVTLYNCNL